MAWCLAGREALCYLTQISKLIDVYQQPQAISSHASDYITTYTYKPAA